MGGTEDGAPSGPEPRSDGQRRAEQREVAHALVQGWTEPVVPGGPTSTLLHPAAHLVGVGWARTLLGIEAFGVPGEPVRPWSELAAARRRCGHFVRHCWHPLSGMGLDWCCCVCGTPREHPGPASRCRLCSFETFAASIPGSHS